ncbi:hypothetical protein IAR55_005869 [Kwoniella newhampshirensis]|uniref:Ammonium transporter AmtB-like domain-containing protein n=1 Tax=Kwoniella newhampshirensis TaxID=1651941 RepID=A0AAW0YT24_9TREE
MSPHTIIDSYNLTISLLVTLGWQLGGFAIAWTLQFDKITDFTVRDDGVGAYQPYQCLKAVWLTVRLSQGGSNFFILALITLLTGNTFYARNIV